jgi:hypothetical protein
LTRNRTEKDKQQLFLHCLFSSHFDLSGAMRLCNVSKKRFDIWTTADPDFARLWDEIEFHKKNFYEAAYHDLIAERNPAVVLHAMKTKNADRGYGDAPVTVNLNGKVDHAHQHEHRHVIDLESLKLPLETRRQILDAYRIQKAEQVKQNEPARLT